MKNLKDSNLLALGRFGIAPLVLGIVVMPFAVISVARLPKEGDAWLVLTMAVTMLICGAGSILYGWWLDRRENHDKDRCSTS